VSSSDKQPARALPLLYFGTAHVSLAVASAVAAVWPHAVAGFFYHSWLVGLVHLITLGWISFSILGAIYIVGPLALRMELPARRGDYVAYGCAVAGLAGMVGHFWLQRYAGMAWAAGTVATAVLYMTVRIVGAVRRAPIQRAVKLHIVLACANFWIAAAMGLLIAADKVAHFLPGFVLANVFAHAHLAAVGWATMMVVGVGYRLLPMTFPSKMPADKGMYASAVLLESGVLGLFATLLLRSVWTPVFGGLLVAGLAVFAVNVAWMRRHLAPKPAGAHRIEFGILHAGSAALSLGAAVMIGIVLLVAPPSPWTLQAAAAYGVAGLIGFLSQMVVAMEARLVPMVTWFWAYSASGYRTPPPSPHVMRDRSLQAVVFGGWTIGVPALAAGMFLASAPLVSIGAWSLLVAVVVATLDNVFVVAPVFRAQKRETSCSSKSASVPITALTSRSDS
jgi:hypothetical protein